jgi:subtilisin family serine protease
LAATAAALLTLGTLTTAAGTAEAAPAPDRQAPLLGTSKADVIDGRYIVVLEGRATGADGRAAVRLAKSEGASDVDRYTTAVEGFSARLSDAAVAALREDPDVAYIEADQRVSIDTTQSPATWGLDRIDQRNLPLNNAYTYTPTGSGVTAYIIDTGVLGTHSEFSGRVARDRESWRRARPLARSCARRPPRRGAEDRSIALGAPAPRSGTRARAALARSGSRPR